MDHDLLGPERKRGMELGRTEGERRIVSQLIDQRFGPIPEWVMQRLDALAPRDI